MFIHQINEVYRNHPTTEEEDASLLSTLSRSITERTGNPDTSPPWNLITAVTYRLLRKRILSLTLRGLNLILMWINSFILEKGKVCLSLPLPPCPFSDNSIFLVGFHEIGSEFAE